MKPRSTVAALLAIAESLLAARAASKTARTKQACRPVRASKLAKRSIECRPPLLRIKMQAIS